MKVNETQMTGERPPDPPALRPKWCSLHRTEIIDGKICGLCLADDVANGRTENDRWWQAFCSAQVIAPNLEGLAERRAVFADAAIIEAKKRGRL